MLEGIAASPGISIGNAVYAQPSLLEVHRHTVLSTDDEKKRFLDAAEVFIQEVEQVRETVSRKHIGEEAADILGVQIAIIRDPEMTKEVLRIIERQSVNAEYAFHMICNGYIALFSKMEDAFMAARAADFKDIRNRMLRILMGIHATDLSTAPPGSIIIAEDIAPSQAALLAGHISGILMSKGTRFSHISIIARALQIPMVVGVPSLFETVKDGDTVILDGNAGCAWANPDALRLQTYRVHLRDQEQEREQLEQYRTRPTCTADGRPFLLSANLSLSQELEHILAYNAHGVGLYRTEFVFMDRGAAPTEEEQFEQYAFIVKAMQGKPVVIRTLDVGGDKAIPYFHLGEETNPFLGYRAVRFCLDHPEIFQPQLSAILRSAVYGDVRILLPMVTDRTELRQVRALVKETEQHLEAQGKPYAANLPIGVMIETPAAVVCAQELAKEADFFSIGTNDLTQYTLAVDRTNSNVAALYNPLHPAVLRMIDMTVKAAHGAGIPVCVCGETAADPRMLPFLLGCGVDEISVNAGSLLMVRCMLKKLSFAAWNKRVPALLSLSEPADVCGEIDRYRSK